ncbi:MAG TPA: dihydrolipoamide acetyltransferase family protein [Saprospiraceae bacterium]|nr:dihydrolipoamide acetyltransferase family protein [Saprospiraceae bacterium]
MAEVINMPRLSDTMEEGNIVAWLKKVGDPVKPGDVLAEVETDKATMELESFYEGNLLYIGVPEGPIQVGALLAIIGKVGEDISSLITGDKSEDKPDEKEKVSKQESSSKEPEQKEMESDKKDTVQQGSALVEDSSTDASIGQTDHRLKASPLAKSIAQESGLDLSSVSGSGDGGRVVKKDVMQAMKAAKTQKSVSTAAVNLEEKTVPLTQIRKTIARRLSESKYGAPHFYVTTEVDMENLMATREQLNAIDDTKISYNDLVVKAVATALNRHPEINSSWSTDAIIYHADINIGVAVATPEGLMVPVIKNAEGKTLSQLNKEIKILAGKAKEKKLSLDEMQGNTFTISNLGMFDVESFTAIINPPDACILAVSSIISKPVVKNNSVVPGHTMKITLSCDHRLIDGVVAAKFLQTLKQMMENPIFMLL